MNNQEEEAEEERDETFLLHPWYWPMIKRKILL
jgi:hypothetical protein